MIDSMDMTCTATFTVNPCCLFVSALSEFLFYLSVVVILLTVLQISDRATTETKKQNRTAAEGWTKSGEETVRYGTVRYGTVLYCTVLYCTVLYCTVLYCTVLYCTVLYCTVLYCTVLYSNVGIKQGSICSSIYD